MKQEISAEEKVRKNQTEIVELRQIFEIKKIHRTDLTTEWR